VERDLSDIISCGRNAKSLYELHSPSINTSHYTSTMLTYGADHEPVKEGLSENEIEPDVEEEGEQVEEETEEMEDPDPKNPPNSHTLSEEVLKRPRCREVGGALHDSQLRRSRELAKSPIVRGGPERATMRSSWRSTPWSTMLNSSEAPRI
jgi:hypothetical protein